MVKVKHLTEKAITPTYATPYAAGMDLYIADPGALMPGERKAFDTDIAVEIPPDCYGQIAPRSSLAVKYGIDTLAGVIDSDYRGSLKVVLINHGDAPVTFNKGDRIAQLIIIKYENVGTVKKVYNLSLSKRGENGFGSTGV